MSAPSEFVQSDETLFFRIVSAVFDRIEEAMRHFPHNFITEINRIRINPAIRAYAGIIVMMLTLVSRGKNVIAVITVFILHIRFVNIFLIQFKRSHLAAGSRFGTPCEGAEQHGSRKDTKYSR